MTQANKTCNTLRSKLLYNKSDGAKQVGINWPKYEVQKTNFKPFTVTEER